MRCSVRITWKLEYAGPLTYFHCSIQPTLLRKTWVQRAPHLFFCKLDYWWDVMLAYSVCCSSTDLQNRSIWQDDDVHWNNNVLHCDQSHCSWSSRIIFSYIFTLEPNGRPVAEIWPFEIFQDARSVVGLSSLYTYTDVICPTRLCYVRNVALEE